MDITRNQLIYILKIIKNENEKIRTVNIDNLLNQYQYQLEEEIQHLKYKIEEDQKNLEFIQEIKEEINK